MPASQEQVVPQPLMDAWQRLLRAHCVLTRVLDAELQSAHGMTISDYDVLVQLCDADGQSLRMSDLSRRTLLTRSGMTRLVQGLERDGLVERRSCANDARVSYAVLTDEGRSRLEQARVTHRAGIARLFASHFAAGEGEQLAALLAQIPGVGDGSSCCTLP